jgi:K+-sensing histidine kinase KdpD
MWPLPDRSQPRLAIAGGVAITLVMSAALVPLYHHTAHAVAALLLVVPVVAAAVVGGRLAGFVVAGSATLAFSLSLPPFGSPVVHLGEDVVALVVFSVVAFVVSALVTTKVAALEHVDEQRRALLRSVSHDLRTPLAAMRGAATDLRARVRDGLPPDDGLLDLLVDETERLDRLVGNLLSMSRIEVGALRPNLQVVDLHELLRASLRRFEHRPDRPLIVDLPEQLPLVRVDHALFEQVVNNLLDNIEQHTPRGTTAWVCASAAPASVLLTVADDGPGLPPEVGRRLATHAHQTSSGLGLAICTAVVALHGGTLRLGNDGSGTSISIEIPRAN